MVDGHDVRRAQDGRGPEGLDGRAAVRARHEAQHGRTVLAELQEEAAVAGRHGNDALGGDRVHLAAVRVLPEQAAGRGVDAEDPGVAHRDHLLPAAHRQQDGRLVRDAVVPEPPAPLSGGEVEARDRTAARGPERDHEHAPGHDRGRAETVEGQLRALARHEVHGPQLAAGGRVEAEEVAARPEAEDPSAAQGRRRDRAVERAVPARERRCDRVAPELLPGARVEGGGHVLAAVGEEGDGAALGHRDRGVARAERGAPGHGEAGAFRGVESRGRGAVVPGAAQAGPVRGVGRRHAREGTHDAARTTRDFIARVYAVRGEPQAEDDGSMARASDAGPGATLRLMSTSARRLHYTYAQYLSLEEDSSVRHEYLDGEIYAMAGGSPDHAALAAALHRHPCAVSSLRLPGVHLGPAGAHRGDRPHHVPRRRRDLRPDAANARGSAGGREPRARSSRSPVPRPRTTTAARSCATTRACRACARC